MQSNKQFKNERIVPVGRFLPEFNSYLPYQLEQETIYRSIGLEKHILKRHPDCLQYVGYIPQILESPDYIGVNPNETSVSFELVKVLSENVQIGISQIAKVGKAPDTLARVPEMMDTPPIL